MNEASKRALSIPAKGPTNVAKTPGECTCSSRSLLHGHERGCPYPSLSQEAKKELDRIFKEGHKPVEGVPILAVLRQYGKAIFQRVKLSTLPPSDCPRFDRIMQGQESFAAVLADCSPDGKRITVMCNCAKGQHRFDAESPVWQTLVP